jgi:hypothetical protein
MPYMLVVERPRQGALPSMTPVLVCATETIAHRQVALWLQAQTEPEVAIHIVPVAESYRVTGFKTAAEVGGDKGIIEYVAQVGDETKEMAVPRIAGFEGGAQITDFPRPR